MTMVGTTTPGTTIFGNTLARMKQLWIRRKVMVVAVVLLVGSGVLFGAVRYSNRAPEVPTLDVKRGEFIDSIQFRGEVKAMKSDDFRASGSGRSADHQDRSRRHASAAGRCGGGV